MKNTDLEKIKNYCKFIIKETDNFTNKSKFSEILNERISHLTNDQNTIATEFSIRPVVYDIFFTDNILSLSRSAGYTDVRPENSYVRFDNNNNFVQELYANLLYKLAIDLDNLSVKNIFDVMCEVLFEFIGQSGKRDTGSLHDNLFTVQSTSLGNASVANISDFYQNDYSLCIERAMIVNNMAKLLGLNCYYVNVPIIYQSGSGNESDDLTHGFNIINIDDTAYYIDSGLNVRDGKEELPKIVFATSEKFTPQQIINLSPRKYYTMKEGKFVYRSCTYNPHTLPSKFFNNRIQKECTKQ